MGILIPYTACEVGVTAGKVVPIRCLTVLLSLKPETRGTGFRSRQWAAAWQPCQAGESLKGRREHAAGRAGKGPSCCGRRKLSKTVGLQSPRKRTLGPPRELGEPAKGFPGGVSKAVPGENGAGDASVFRRRQNINGQDDLLHQPWF